MYKYIKHNINTFKKNIIYSSPETSPELKMVVIVAHKATSHLPDKI